MTATSITHMVAQEQINDLMRDAQRWRRAADVRSPGRVRFSIPRVFSRRVARTATVSPLRTRSINPTQPEGGAPCRSSTSS